MKNKTPEIIDREFGRYRNELFDLLGIPSVSTDPELKEETRKAAHFLKRQLEQIGMDRTEIFDTQGHPILFAERCRRPDRPTVLIYGHYDVQPPDPLDEWHSPPFEPEVREGRVYARGASDDKGQMFTHLKAVEALLESDGELPVNVKFLIEGEEEIGSPNLVPFLKREKELLACDMVVISDTAMFDEDRPSITYGLRGLAYMEIEVKGPIRDLHSGVYGGAIDNPAQVLVTMLSGLRDENGRVLIEGFYDDVRPLTKQEREATASLPFDEKRYRSELGVKKLNGEKGYSTLERTSARPTLDINGLWSGYQGKGAKTVLPAKAGAKVSMRLVPDQDPKKIARLFERTIRSLSPDTVELNVTEHHGGSPVLVNLDFYGIKAAAEAFSRVYETEVLFSREGGSIPIVADFKNVLGAPSILMGFGLAKDALHSPNESFSLRDFRRGILTSAEFLSLLTEYSAPQG